MQDVSFWLPETGFTENDLCEVVRSEAGDLVESVVLTDEFTNPKKGQNLQLLPHRLPLHGALADGRGNQQHAGAALL